MTWHGYTCNAPELPYNKTEDAFYICLRACCEQVLFLAASVCASVRTKSQKLLIRNWCNLVGLWIMMNAGGGWKLVTFDLGLDLESYSRTYLRYNFWLLWSSKFVFDAEIRLENIYVTIQFQGHRAKIKVTAGKNGCAQVCAPLGHCLIQSCFTALFYMRDETQNSEEEQVKRKSLQEAQLSLTNCPTL